MFGSADGASPPTCGPSPSSTSSPRSGSGVNNTVHNSYLSDAYPTEGRGRVFSWHNLSDPLSQTVGILIFGYVVTVAHNWRYGPPGRPGRHPHGLRPLHAARTGEGGQREQPHPEGLGHGPALPAGEGAPGPAGIGHDPAAAHPLALLRAGGRGHPRLRRHRCAAVRQPLLRPTSSTWTPPAAARSTPSSAWPPSSGLPVAYVIGDRYFRRAPQRPLVIAGFCITAYGVLFVASLYMPKLWMVVTLQFLANAAVSPLAICIFLTLAATAPPEMRTICFAMFGVYSLVFGGFAGCGHPRRRLRRHRRPARHRRVAHPHRPGLPRRRIPADPRLAQCQARHHPGHRGRARALRRGQAPPGRRGRSRPCRSTTSTSTTAPTRCSSTSTSRSTRARWWPCSGTNGAGKSTLLRAVSGLVASPPRRDPDLRDELHLPRARADHRPGRGPAGGRAR